jgi:xanthine dehydrogenase YagR molybdenum-binding subunit
MSGYIGQDVSRVDRGAKVTGSARSSGEIALPDLAHAEMSAPGAASGRITSIDLRACRGRGRVLTHRNMPKIDRVPLVPSFMGGQGPGETFFPMQDDEVRMPASRLRSSWRRPGAGLSMRSTGIGAMGREIRLCAWR